MGQGIGSYSGSTLIEIGYKALVAKVLDGLTASPLQALGCGVSDDSAHLHPRKDAIRHLHLQASRH